MKNEAEKENKIEWVKRQTEIYHLYKCGPKNHGSRSQPKLLGNSHAWVLNQHIKHSHICSFADKGFEAVKIMSAKVLKQLK